MSGGLTMSEVTMRGCIVVASLVLIPSLSSCGHKNQSALAPESRSRPSVVAAGDMDYLSALQLISSRTGQVDTWNGIPSHVTANEIGITVTGKKGVYHCPYRDTPSASAKSFSGAHWVTVKCHGPDEGQFQMLSNSKAESQTLAAAWQRMAAGPPIDTPEQAAAFDAAADNYRANAAAFVLPEEARALKVQAETAVGEKRIWDAADRFSKGVRISPTWPAGHFNLALVYGELELPTLAIYEMKKYLKLAPDAENARAAQDKIYAWQDKAGR